MRRLAATAIVLGALAPFGAAAADGGVVVHPVTGCVSKGAMVRAHELREQEDPAAVRLLLAQGLRNGDCRLFAPGEPVIIEDGDILAGISKVHTLGDPQAFWVPERAIRD